MLSKILRDECCRFRSSLPLWWIQAEDTYKAIHKDLGWIYKMVCGNKMPNRCNRGFYCRFYCLLNVFRASPCPSSGAQEYYTVVAACGIFMRPVCRMLVNQHPANRTTAQNTTRSNLLSSWWWAWWCPKHVEQAIRSAIKTSVASSWHFISTSINIRVAWKLKDISGLGDCFLLSKRSREGLTTQVT